MGLPAPQDPDDQAAPGDGRADWLCGPEEGIEAELQRTERTEVKLPAPSLFRPGQSGVADPAAVSRAPDAPPASGSPSSLSLRLPPPRPAPGAPANAAQPVPTMSWEPGPSSVPVVRRDAVPFEAPAANREFPMDDAEERARARQDDFAAAAEAAELTARPHEIVTPEAFDVQAATVPWWMQMLHVVRTDRRVQVVTAAVLAVVLVIGMWPRGPRPTSIRDLHRHADRYQDRVVHVEGRVGEVFPVGGGYAFYLRDGRDTMVVFTRSRTPERDEHVKIDGTVSTGYLDGQARTALFETFSSH